jgi:chemotaxis protein histidine kinase CheA
MANIDEYLNKIMAARKGEEVRGSIHDAIEEINIDAETAVADAADSAGTAQASAEAANASAKLAEASAQLAADAATGAANSATSAEEAKASADAAVENAEKVLKDWETTKAEIYDTELPKIQAAATDEAKKGSEEAQAKAEEAQSAAEEAKAKAESAQKGAEEATASASVSALEAQKWAETAQAASGITVDSELDETSPNAVQNKVIAARFKADAERMNGSEKELAGVKEAIEGQEKSLTKLEGEAHSHDNKGVLDNLTQKVIDNSHTHANKSTLDKISESEDGNLLFNGEEIKGGGGSLSIPPKNPTNVSVKGMDETLKVYWTDPEDNIVEGTTLASWGGTILVINDDHAPQDETDGVVIVNNKIRDTYATTPMEITELENNKTYYLYFVPYTTAGTYGYSDSNRYIGMPAKVFLDDVTDVTTEAGDKTLKVTWTNPEQTKTENDITATWAKTTVVIKADGYPVSEADGIAYESTDYSEGEHEFEVENGYDYYVRFFIESDLGSVKQTDVEDEIATYATLTVTTEETTLIGKEVKATWTDEEEKTLIATFDTSMCVQLKIPFIGEVNLRATDGTGKGNKTVIVSKWGNYNTKFSFYTVLTLKIDLTNSNPATCISLADDAVGMSQDEIKTWFGHYPVLFKDGQEIGRLNPDNYAQFEDGSDADITTLGNDVMVAFPRRGLVITNDNDTTITVSMTDDPDNPDFEYYAHTRGTTAKDVFYVGAYKGHVSGEKLYSLSNHTYLQQNVTHNKQRAYAHARGAGYEISAFYQWTFLQCVYLFVHQNLDAQTAVGLGHDFISPTYKDVTGETDKYGMDSEIIKSTNPNYMTDGVHRVKCLGIESLWSDTTELLDGEYVDSSGYICTSTGDFDDEYSNYARIEQDTPFTKNAKWMTKPQGTTKGGFMVTEEDPGGSSSTYFCDVQNIHVPNYPVVSGFGNSNIYRYYAGMFYYGSRADLTTDVNGHTSRLMYLPPNL